MRRALLLATGATGGPGLDLNFVDGSPFDGRITFTRASGATYFDATGTLQTAATNAARIDYGPLPGGRTNWIRNSSAAGAVAGTPGTAPTNWNIAAVGGNGITTTIVGSGTDSGFPYVDIQFSGTNSTGSTVFPAVNMEPGTVIAATIGQTWTESVYLRLISGSSPTLNLSYAETASSGSFLLGHLTGSLVATGALQRLSGSAATTQATCAFVYPYINFSVASGASVNFTIRIGAPQFELGSAATAWISTTSGAANVGATPLGLLIEEQRTNSIRNPRGEGAVAGTPGTVPTNWSNNLGSTGLSTQIVGTGTETGIPYLDVRWFGTTTAASALTMFLDTGTGTGAATAQAWTLSAYLRIVGGSLANVTSTVLLMQELTSGLAFVASGTGSALSLGSSPLASQRQAYVRTLSGGATVAAVQGAVRVNVPTGVAIDFTLRIGAPQLELGAFATSLILPAVGTPAATTRAVDLALITGQSLSMMPATIAAEVIYGQQNSSISPVAMLVGDAAGANRVLIFNQASGASASALLTVASTNVATASASGLTFGAVSKQAASYQSSAVNEALNGALATAVVPSATAITTADRLILGSNGGGTAMGGYIRRARYWPRALSPSELQTVTT